MEWEEQDQVNEDSGSNSDESSDKSGSENEDNSEKTLNEKNTIRSELKSMSFAELLKLKEELGSKVYNEALFGEESTPKKRKNEVKHKSEFKRENKNRPREISAKRQVPLLGKAKTSKNDLGPRDPRFDSKCGDFDRNKFKEDYGFVNEIRDKEISELKEQLKKLKGDQVEEKTKVKLVLQRMQNQNLEEKKLQERKQAMSKEREKNNSAIKNERKPFFLSKCEQKAQDLVKQFEELKKSGRLNKHLEKRRKKNMTRDRKKYNFD